MIKKAGGRLLDLVFPPAIYCLACEKPIAADSLYSLCPSCANNLSWANRNTCAACGKPLEDWYPAALCADCTGSPKDFDAGLSCLQYRDREREIIHEFKYHGKSYMARNLSEVMADKIKSSDLRPDILIPVPMYGPKEKKRGYNQADLLARFAAERLGIGYLPHALVRTRPTAPMNKLSAKERKRNLEGVFAFNEACRKEILHKKIMIIDDIYTTGTTMDHCGHILRANGASVIYVMSLASGKNQRDLPDIETLS